MQLLENLFYKLYEQVLNERRLYITGDIIFGVINKNNFQVRLKLGKMRDTHSIIRHITNFENYYTFRFSPITNTVYWWDDDVSATYKEIVNEKLKNRGFTNIEHKPLMTREGRLASHGRDSFAN